LFYFYFSLLLCAVASVGFCYYNSNFFKITYRYEGEWFANKKYGYGVTTFRDGTKEEGKYKNNVLITSQKKKHLFLIRSAKFRERIDAAVDSAQRASKYALQKADIAISRTATARGKAEQADLAADHARVDSEVAIQTAREFAPDFKPSLLERFERIRIRDKFRNVMSDSGGGGATSNQISNTLSPNKSNLMAASTASRNQNVNNQIKEQQNNASAAASHQQQQQQQQISNNNQSSRRASVNSMNRQKSMDYAHMNQTSNQQNSSMDMSNTLGQQFGQPQPPGKSPMTTPQKYSQQNNHVQDQSSHYQQQNSDNYQNYSQMSSNDYQQQSQQQTSSTDYMGSGAYGGGSRRNSSRLMSESGRPMLGSINQAASIDHFDHYKRPPSRDSSVDRYSRAASRLGGGSRQPSIDRQVPSVINSTSNEVPQIDRNVRAGSQMRGTTPAPQIQQSNGQVLTGIGSRQGSRAGTPVFQPTKQQLANQIQAQYSTPNQPFEDILLRQRTLGQDIIPSPAQPKRTESLFVPNNPMPSGGASGGGGGGSSGRSGGSKVNFILRRISFV
jgi:junctophilin